MTTPTQPHAKARTEPAERSQPLRSPAPAAEGFASPFLELQHAVGNQAVGHLLRGSLLQPKLRIGPPGDAYEREADHVADAVLGEGETPVSISNVGGAGVQRMCAECEEEMLQRKCHQCQEEEEELVQPKAGGGPAQSTPGFEARVDALRGSGRPLPTDVRSFFEPRFGHDFGAVRVHTGAAAGEAAQAVRARAFTVCNDVVFGAGAWSPGTTAGKHLLAHELTHVVQQTPLVARRKPLLQRAPQESGEETPQTEESAPEPAPEPTASPDEPTPETAPGEQAPAAAVVVEDDATEVGEGQMKKSEFLARLRPAVLAAADAGLSDKDRAEQASSSIDLWLGQYETKDAEQLNSDLSRLVSGERRPTTAEGYISAIAETVRTAVATWERTGEVPPELSLFGSELAGGGAGGLLGELGSVFFKALPGGPRNPGNPQTLRAQLGAGRPLDGGVRSRMESAFGRSFSHVRVHADGHAAGLSDRLNARAFTVGEHVAFGSRQYQPGTILGDALLAHELAHVAQQDGAPESVQPMRADAVSSGALERDADMAAVGAVASLWGLRLPGLRLPLRAAPRMSSGLRLQRCECCNKSTAPSQATGATPAPGATPGPSAAQPQPAEQFCATESDHAGIIALRVKAGLKAPKGTLAYGFTFWEPKDSATKPKLEIEWTKAGSAWTGTVKRTTTAMGTVEALFLKEGDHEIPGKKVTAKGPKCGPAGKEVPFVSTLSKELSLLSRRAEQEHCNDYKRAFDLTYQKWADNINSLAGKSFGPGTKAAVTKQINDELSNMGDKGRKGWVAELNRLNALSVSERDGKGWHSLKPDGDPVAVEAACTKVQGTTVKNATTNVPGPPSEDIVK